MGRAPIINEMNKAKQSIQLVMYNFTDKQILNALVQQRKNGRDIQVILEKSPYRAGDINKKTISKLKRNDIEWHGKVADARLVHQKTLLIDQHEAMVMTFNFTQSSFKNQRNFAIILDNPDEVNDIARHFKNDWQGVSTYNSTNNLIWSPDDSRQKLLTIINNAKKELHIYAQSVTDKKIIAALDRAAARGVDVTIITNHDRGNASPLAALTTIHNNVKIISSTPYYIHAKIFIIDNQIAVIGSINLTKSSLDQNRELAIITRDAEIIKQLQATFASDSNPG
jgi:phosphatidylserine/phosphatidylglycerophosphate/cardiolipin synthase-like enzyme